MEFWGCPTFMKTKPPKQSPEKKTGQEALAAIAAWHNAKQQVEPSLRFFEKTLRFHIHPTSNFPIKTSQICKWTSKMALFFRLKMSEHVV